LVLEGVVSRFVGYSGLLSALQFVLRLALCLRFSIDSAWRDMMTLLLFSVRFLMVCVFFFYLPFLTTVVLWAPFKLLSNVHVNLTADVSEC